MGNKRHFTTAKTDNGYGPKPSAPGPRENKDDADTSRTFGTFSNVGFAVGVVGIGVGVYGLVRGRPAAAPNAARVTPIVGPNGVGLVGAF